MLQPYVRQNIKMELHVRVTRAVSNTGSSTDPGVLFCLSISFVFGHMGRGGNLVFLQTPKVNLCSHSTMSINVFF